MADAMLSEPDRVGELAGIGVPLLVAHGREDDAWPPSVQQDMAVRAGAHHVVIERSLHSPAVDNPVDTAAALLRFFAEVEFA
jgi:pimeloyl-ACP methyl ester carboxylesterase